jgi:hypothetical protein
LWSHGLSLAIYDRIGILTNGGQTEFFATRQTLSKYFGSSYEATRRAFLVLVNNGWLTPVPNEEGHFTFIKHDVWAFTTDYVKCVEQQLNPWHAEADPFIGRLFAVAGGKFRAKPHWLLGIRKYGYSDDEVLKLFTTEIAAAKAKRDRGAYGMTSPSQCFYRVHNYLKQNSRIKK